MHRIKNHNIKREVPETSSSRLQYNQDHDLAYYIHDRVELMHQVFSVIKPKDLKAMAPECVQHISIDDLQELCTEEVNYQINILLLAIILARKVQLYLIK